jgi:hypothetical protein
VSLSKSIATAAEARANSLPVSNLQVERSHHPWRPGNFEGSDKVFRRKARFNIRRVAGKLVQLLKGYLTTPRYSPDLDSRVQRNERLGEIARICRDAIVAHAKNGMFAIDAGHGGATAAGIALVTGGRRGIAEIVAARSL